MKPTEAGRSAHSAHSWPLLAHILMVADITLAVRVGTILWRHFAGHAWRLMLGLPLIVAAGWPREQLRRPPGPESPGALAIAGLAVAGGPARRRRGFTLIELLVVLVIVVLVSAVALPTVLPAIQHWQSSEAARLLQAALAGARDKAIHDGQPSGIRLLPDPAFPISYANGQVDGRQPLAFNRWLPVSPAPQYSEGLCTVRPGAGYLPIVTNPAGGAIGGPFLVLESSPLDRDGLPAPPTSWSWNLRVGERIQINGGGPWYTIVGPCWISPWSAATPGNAELFVNTGLPGAASPLSPPGLGPVEYLLLVDARDDNGNGWVDEAWDGVDNDGNGLVDDPNEWGEVEQWHGAAAGSAGLASVPYLVRRRPAPTTGAREIALPAQVVIDATSWSGTRERSRLPVDRFTGSVELLINPDGTAVPTTLYSTPSSVGMDGAFLHFWLAERPDVASPAVGVSPAVPAPKGEYWLVSLFARTGQVVTNQNPPLSGPFAQAQQGIGQ